MGEKNVKRLGKHIGHISTKDIKPLFQYVREMEFFSLDDYYSTGATDQPTVFTMAVRNGRQKIVKNYGSAAPLKLWALENVIDALLAEAAWTAPK